MADYNNNKDCFYLNQQQQQELQFANYFEFYDSIWHQNDVKDVIDTPQQKQCVVDDDDDDEEKEEEDDDDESFMFDPNEASTDYCDSTTSLEEIKSEDLVNLMKKLEKVRDLWTSDTKLQEAANVIASDCSGSDTETDDSMEHEVLIFYLDDDEQK